MSHTRTRRHFSAEQKAEIVRRHLGGKEPISKLAEGLGVQASLINNWVNQVLARCHDAFDTRSHPVSRYPQPNAIPVTPEPTQFMGS